MAMVEQEAVCPLQCPTGRTLGLANRGTAARLDSDHIQEAQDNFLMFGAQQREGRKMSSLRWKEEPTLGRSKVLLRNALNGCKGHHDSKITSEAIQRNISNWFKGKPLKNKKH